MNITLLKGCFSQKEEGKWKEIKFDMPSKPKIEFKPHTLVCINERRIFHRIHSTETQHQEDSLFTLIMDRDVDALKSYEEQYSFHEGTTNIKPDMFFRHVDVEICMVSMHRPNPINTPPLHYQFQP